MDYAIYKTFGDGQPQITHLFTQEDNNHRAKSAARQWLNELWLGILHRQYFLKTVKNAKGSVDEVSYDYLTSINTCERVRWYIAPL